MSITLDLPQELEQSLTEEAQRLGLPLPAYILRLLSAGSPRQPIRSGAGLVGYWQAEGVIGSRPDIVDSQAHARQLRHQAENRQRGVGS